jgi:hypothetical protein
MPIHGYPGGVITANPTAPTVSSASGVWTTEQQLLATAAGNWPGYEYPISNSLRFNSADSAYLSRTPASASNRETWTWSGWVKRTAVTNTGQNLFSTDNGSSTTIGQLFFNDAILEFNCYASSAYQWRLITTQVWRDLSAWYHIVAVLDTTQATSSNRVKLYVNGVQITAFSTATYPSQNFDGAYNLNQPHYIGAAITSSGYLNGYLTEVNFIDGQALTPSSFGLNDPETGVWSPKRYTGTYGTNGFYLKFLPSYSGGSISADFLVVAGGAGGGSGRGAGAGAGGYRTSAGTSGGGASPESALSVAIGTAYTVTVGAGGNGGTSAGNGSNGSNSVFSTITSTGGGGGAGNLTGIAGNGGSGGGDVIDGGSLAGTGTVGQGKDGGLGGGASGYGGGGGGGASAVGSAGTTSVGGAGGAGLASSITGSSVDYAGGGGGGAFGGGGGTGGSASFGGGAGSGSAAGTAGTVNTGGGGGGGGYVSSNLNGGNGGSGIVIIKIPSQYSANFTSGVTYSISTAVSGFKIYTVTATSTTSETVTFV